MNRSRALAASSLFAFLAVSSNAQTSLQALPPGLPAASSGDDPKAILEFGAATGWNLSGGAATFAPNVAAEITPIEHWLEIEAGVSPFFGWYLEPAFDYSFSSGHQKSIGVSGASSLVSFEAGSIGISHLRGRIDPTGRSVLTDPGRAESE